MVVELIQALKDRGHRAYKNLDMERVRATALGPEGLPKDGILGAVVQLLQIKPDADSLDRIQIQREATPVPGRCQTDAEASRIFDVISPNAVVCARSNDDGIDVVADRQLRRGFKPRRRHDKCFKHHRWFNLCCASYRV